MSASVYVGDLVAEVTEESLHQIFSAAGSIRSVTICREAVSGRSLGYGYVNYASPRHAQTALEMFNHLNVMGRSIRVMPSQRDAYIRRSGIGNLYVKNLEPNLVTNRILHDKFQSVGPVLSAKVATDDRGQSKGYGYVQYEDIACANLAKQVLDGTELCGRILSVADFLPAKDRSVDPDKFSNVYVRNLGINVDEAELQLAFSEFGPLNSTVILRDRNGQSRGFGFANFRSPDDAARAVEAMDGHMHQGLKWKVSAARKRNEQTSQGQQQQSPSATQKELIISNLPLSCTVRRLESLFQKFGTIESARITRDKNDGSRCNGYVLFQDQQDALSAIREMDSKVWDGAVLRVAFLHSNLGDISPRESAQRPAPRMPSPRSTTLNYNMPTPSPIAGPPSLQFIPGVQFFYGVPVMMSNSQQAAYMPYQQHALGQYAAPGPSTGLPNYQLAGPSVLQLRSAAGMAQYPGSAYFQGQPTAQMLSSELEDHPSLYTRPSTFVPGTRHITQQKSRRLHDQAEASRELAAGHRAAAAALSEDPARFQGNEASSSSLLPDSSSLSKAGGSAPQAFDEGAVTIGASQSAQTRAPNGKTNAPLNLDSDNS